MSYDADSIFGKLWLLATSLAFYVSTLMAGQWSSAVASAAGAAMSLFPQSVEATASPMAPWQRFLISGLVGFFVSELVDYWWPGTRVPASFVIGLLGVPLLGWVTTQLKTTTISDLVKIVVARFGGGGAKE